MRPPNIKIISSINSTKRHSPIDSIAAPIACKEELWKENLKNWSFIHLNIFFWYYLFIPSLPSLLFCFGSRPSSYSKMIKSETPGFVRFRSSRRIDQPGRPGFDNFEQSYISAVHWTLGTSRCIHNTLLFLY